MKVTVKAINNEQVVEFGDLKYFTGSSADDWSKDDILAPENFGEVKKASDFVSLCFHYVQQTGGYLTYKGKKLEALDIEDTGGFGISLDTDVKYGSSKVKLGSLIKESKKVPTTRVGKILESLGKIKESKLTPEAEEVFRKLKAGEYKKDQIPHEDFMLIFNPLYDDSGCFLDRAEKVIEEYGDAFQNQECYCGYSAKKDVFLMAFEGDFLKTYTNYDGDEEEDYTPFSVVISGRFDAKTSRWSDIKLDETYNNMFYGGAHKHLSRKYPDLVGIRLD